MFWGKDSEKEKFTKTNRVWAGYKPISRNRGIIIGMNNFYRFVFAHENLHLFLHLAHLLQKRTYIAAVPATVLYT